MKQCGDFPTSEQKTEKLPRVDKKARVENQVRDDNSLA